jgi:hypothetical protein
VENEPTRERSADGMWGEALQQRLSRPGIISDVPMRACENRLFREPGYRRAVVHCRALGLLHKVKSDYRTLTISTLPTPNVF